MKGIKLQANFSSKTKVKLSFCLLSLLLYSNANAQYFSQNYCDAEDYKRRELRRELLDELENRLSQKAPIDRLTSIQYSLPQTDIYSFSKTFGKQWYTFGLNSSANYNAVFKANARTAELMANANSGAFTNVVLFNTNIPVLDIQIGSGNYQNLFDTTNGLFKDEQPTGNKKWLPTSQATIKVFGINVFNKKFPKDYEDEKKQEKLLEALQAKFNSNREQFNKKTDQFMEMLKAKSTNLGDDTDPEKIASSSTTPENKSIITKAFPNYRRSAKDVLGSTLVIPVMPPLNVEIDFGVYFNSSLIFEFGLAGAGFSLNQSTNLAEVEPGRDSFSKLKESAQSFKNSNAFQCMSDFRSCDLGLVNSNSCDGGGETLSWILQISKKSNFVDGAINSEFKANVRLMPSMKAGAFASASAVIDMGVASASAGVIGNLNLVDVKIGGGLDFSTASDYANITSNGNMSLMSGSLDLFAKLKVDAVVAEKSWDWNWNLFNFNGINREFPNIPVARFAHRGPGTENKLLRGFMCIDGNFKRKKSFVNSSSLVNECDLNVIKVPQEDGKDISRTIASIVNTHADSKAPDPDHPCLIVLNGNTIVSSSSDNSCLNELKSETTIRTARALVPEKFSSTLYDNDKPVLLLESFYNESKNDSYFYSGEDVSSYEDYSQKWSQFYEGAKLSGQSPDSVDFVPESEPEVNIGSTRVPVSKVGKLNDDELFSASNKSLTGFCSVFPTNNKENFNNQCQYSVKVKGINYPDGSSCISNYGTLIKPSDEAGKVITTTAANYDCATSSDGRSDSKKVAACLLRRAFADGLCYPPNKAQYLVKLNSYLETLTDHQLFEILLTPQNGSVVEVPKSIPKSTTCSLSAARHSWPSYKFKTREWNSKCSKNNPSAKCNKITGADLIKSECIAPVTARNTSYCYYESKDENFTLPSIDGTAEIGTIYSGQCNVSLLNSKGSKASETVIKCRDKTGISSVTGSASRCNCMELQSPTNTVATLGANFRNAVKNGDCELNPDGLNLNKTKLDEIKPDQTCELVAQTPPLTGEPVVLPFQFKAKNFNNLEECKTALSGANDILCAQAKENLKTSSSERISLSARFQGNQAAEVTTCEYSPDGDTQDLGETLSRSEDSPTSSGCDILIGPSKDSGFVVNQYKNFEGSASDCGKLIPELTKYCSNLDGNIVSKLRQKYIDIDDVEVFARINQKTGNNFKTIEITSLGKCDASGNGAKLAQDENGKTLSACDLLATDNHYGNLLVIDRKKTDLTTTADSCLKLYQPSKLVCEQLTQNPIIQKENKINPLLFPMNKAIKLQVRFTPSSNQSSGKVITDLTPECVFGKKTELNTKCDLLVKLTDGTQLRLDGTKQTVGKTQWSTAKLTSNSDSTSEECYQRFLNGAKLPSVAADSKDAPMNITPTCFGISAQVAASNVAASESSLKNATVSLYSSFTDKSKTSAPVYIGSCKYDATGKIDLKQITIEKSDQGTLADANKTSIVYPKIKDFIINPANPDTFFASVTYDGPAYPTVKFSGFKLLFPFTDKSAIKKVIGNSDCTGTVGANYQCRLPKNGEVMRVGPFPIEFLRGMECKSTFETTLKTDVVYPAVLAQGLQTSLVSSMKKSFSNQICSGKCLDLTDDEILKITDLSIVHGSNSIKISYINPSPYKTQCAKTVELLASRTFGINKNQYDPLMRLSLPVANQGETKSITFDLSSKLCTFNEKELILEEEIAIQNSDQVLIKKSFKPNCRKTDNSGGDNANLVCKAGEKKAGEVEIVGIGKSDKKNFFKLSYTNKKSTNLTCKKEIKVGCAIFKSNWSVFDSGTDNTTAVNSTGIGTVPDFDQTLSIDLDTTILCQGKTGKLKVNCYNDSWTSKVGYNPEIDCSAAATPTPSPTPSPTPTPKPTPTPTPAPTPNPTPVCSEGSKFTGNLELISGNSGSKENTIKLEMKNTDSATKSCKKTASITCYLVNYSTNSVLSVNSNSIIPDLGKSGFFEMDYAKFCAGKIGPVNIQCKNDLWDSKNGLLTKVNCAAPTPTPTPSPTPSPTPDDSLACGKFTKPIGNIDVSNLEHDIKTGKMTITYSNKKSNVACLWGQKINCEITDPLSNNKLSTISQNLVIPELGQSNSLELDVSLICEKSNSVNITCTTTRSSPNVIYKKSLPCVKNFSNNPFGSGNSDTWQ